MIFAIVRVIYHNDLLANLQPIRRTGMQAGSLTAVPNPAHQLFPSNPLGILRKRQDRIRNSSDREGGEAGAEVLVKDAIQIRTINAVSATQNMQAEVHIFRTMKQ